MKIGEAKMKTLGEMTDAEKGALLLAYHEGKEIEWYDSNYQDWDTCFLPIWKPTLHYRVKKAVVKSTKVVYMCYEDGYAPFVSTSMSDPTHKITFNTIGGVPDCSSIKMEKV